MGRASRTKAERRRGATVTDPAARIGVHGELIPRRGTGWSRRINDRVPNASAWATADGLLVLSSLDDAVLPGSDDQVGPTWIVSTSRIRVGGSSPLNRDARRPTDDDLRRVVAAFGLPAFDEDNHYPGVSRIVFCPLDERWRTACECKVTEALIVEPDGYTWTTPRDDNEGCRGCEAERWRFIERCPIHGAER